MEETKKLLIIDGNGRIVRDFYGSAPYPVNGETEEQRWSRCLRTKDGRASNAVAVSLPGILKYILYFKPDMVAVCFDKNRNTFRRALYPGYKAQRNESPAPLKEQILAMQDLLRKAGIPVLSMDGYEADDIVCTLARRYEMIPGVHIDIVSGDHDYLQLVDSNITVWMPQASKEAADAMYTSFGYFAKEREAMPAKLFPYRDDTDVSLEMGVTAGQVPDIKGLAGDSSDNIPGVRGISSAAAPLIAEYGDIDGIYAAIFNDPKAFADKCRTLGIKRNPVNTLLKGMGDAYLCRTLATMVEIPGFDFLANDLEFELDLKALRDIEKDWELVSSHNVISECIIRYGRKTADDEDEGGDEE